MVENASINDNEVIDCREDDGAFRDSLRANNRKLFWEDICAELIDNALEHSGDTCDVLLEWNKRNGEYYFRCIDNGFGSEDIRAFFKPGKTLGTGKSTGNSTFGMGLFVCECCISSPDSYSSLRVATYSGKENILIGTRTIDKSSSVSRQTPIYDDVLKRRFCIGDHGTNVTFSRFSKRIPKGEEYSRISKNLGRAYATAINSGSLRVNMVKDGVSTLVLADEPPSVEELRKCTVDIEGHKFDVEWGVTSEACRDNGCRLIYGGKFFDTTDSPCKQYNIGRFYASIRIPRDIGKLSMDILKRCVDHPIIDELFTKCSELFLPELIESDAICRAGEDKSLNADISHLLSVAIKPDAQISNTDDDVDEPNRREFRGRDMTKEGVEPTGTGPKHRRTKRKAGIPDACSVFWARLGEEKGLAVYQHDTNRITFNEDVPIMVRYREEKNKILLASIASGHIAKSIEGSSRQSEFGFGDKDYDWIYRVMMERVAASC